MTTSRFRFRPCVPAPLRRIAAALAASIVFLGAANGRAEDAGADATDTEPQTDAAHPIELIDPNSRVRFESHCQPDRVYRQPAFEIEQIQIEGDVPAAAIEGAIEEHYELLARCFDDVTGGTLSVTFEVDATGAAMNTDVVADHAPTAARCVDRVVDAMTVAATGATSVVSFRLRDGDAALH